MTMLVHWAGAHNFNSSLQHGYCLIGDVWKGFAFVEGDRTLSSMVSHFEGVTKTARPQYQMAAPCENVPWVLVPSVQVANVFGAHPMWAC